MTREQILKKGGFANTPEGIKAFYKKYNTPEKFFAEHGGSLSGAPHDGQPTADQFFSYGAPALGHMNIPMSNPTYLAHGGMYHSDGPFYHAEPGMIINPGKSKAKPVPAPDVDDFMDRLDNPPLKTINFPKFKTRAEYNRFKAGNPNFAKYSDADMQGLGVNVPYESNLEEIKKREQWNKDHPWTPSSGTTPEGGRLFHKTGESGTPQDYFFNTKTSTYDLYNPGVATMAYGGVAEYCWGGLPGGPNEMPRMGYGGYMDMGGYNSPTNYGSFSVPMNEGGEGDEQLTPEQRKQLANWAAKEKAILDQRTNNKTPKNLEKVNKIDKKWTEVFNASGDIYQGVYGRPGTKVVVDKDKNRFDSLHESPINPNLAAYFKGKKMIIGPTKNTQQAKDLANDFNIDYFYKKDNELFPIYEGSPLVNQEYGGVLDASNNQDYPIMDQGGMESMSKGNIIKMLKQAARQRKKAYREGGNTSMQGGNANNIPQQITDNFRNGVSKLYNNFKIDEETDYLANQINAMDQEMMPMANMGMQIGQYQNYISNLENQNQSAFGNMLNSATNLAATLPRGSQNPVPGAPTVSDITKASEPVKADLGISMMDYLNPVNQTMRGIQDVNKKRAEEEQKKTYENKQKEAAYNQWNNTYNSGSQDSNKPWWEQPYRFSFNDPRGFAGMFPDSYYKFNTEGSRTIKEAKDRKLPFTSMEVTHGAGAKAVANIGKLFGKDPNETLTKFSPKKIRYYFGQPAGQGTKQPATANTPAAANAPYAPITANQAANPYGQIPEGTTQAPAPYLPASVKPGYDASGRLLNPPQSLPGTNLFNMNAQLKEYTGKPLNESISQASKQSRVEDLMNPFSADAQRQLDIMRGPKPVQSPGVFYNEPQQKPYNFMENVEANQSPMRAYGGMPMAQWGFANPVDMTMLGISNTKPELYADAKLKRDYSAAAPFIPGAISNVTQGINISKNQKAIEQAKNELYDPAGKFAQATTGNKGVEEINTQAFMPDKSMDSPYQTSAYSSRVSAYGGSFQDGGMYEEGEEYDLTDEQIEALENAGYVLKY
jgi:hypothetical protein